MPLNPQASTLLQFIIISVNQMNIFRIFLSKESMFKTHQIAQFKKKMGGGHALDPP